MPGPPTRTIPAKGARRILAPALLLLAGCLGRDELLLPTNAEVRQYFASGVGSTAEMRGNVAHVTVTQPAAHLRRGGSLWAKVGPYIFLFTPETKRLFADYSGLAGVRVQTRIPDGTKVAHALLRRGRLNDLTWRSALNVAGKARTEGTGKPDLLVDLVDWGEEHTEFSYSSRFVKSN